MTRTGKGRSAYRVLVGKPEGRGRLGRPKRRGVLNGLQTDRMGKPGLC